MLIQLTHRRSKQEKDQVPFLVSTEQIVSVDGTSTGSTLHLTGGRSYPVCESPGEILDLQDGVLDPAGRQKAADERRKKRDEEAEKQREKKAKEEQAKAEVAQKEADALAAEAERKAKAARDAAEKVKQPLPHSEPPPVQHAPEPPRSAPEPSFGRSHKKG